MAEKSSITATVEFAVYGALMGGDENKAAGLIVTGALQSQINENNGIVKINNTTMGAEPDPAPKNTKHFGAIVNVNGTLYAYACEENQEIDFFHHV